MCLRSRVIGFVRFRDYHDYRFLPTCRVVSQADTRCEEVGKELTDLGPPRFSNSHPIPEIPGADFLDAVLRSSYTSASSKGGKGRRG